MCGGSAVEYTENIDTRLRGLYPLRVRRHLTSHLCRSDSRPLSIRGAPGACPFWAGQTSGPKRQHTRGPVKTARPRIVAHMHAHCGTSTYVYLPKSAVFGRCDSLRQSGRKHVCHVCLTVTPYAPTEKCRKTVVTKVFQTSSLARGGRAAALEGSAGVGAPSLYFLPS